MAATRPPQMPGEAELREILNYTIVALVGMVGGFIIGYIFCDVTRARSAETPASAVVRPP